MIIAWFPYELNAMCEKLSCEKLGLREEQSYKYKKEFHTFAPISKPPITLVQLTVEGLESVSSLRRAVSIRRLRDSVSLPGNGGAIPVAGVVLCECAR